MTAPDPAYYDQLRRSLAASPHLLSLVGLMQERGLAFVHVEATTDHGVPWIAIVAQGESAVPAMVPLAEAIDRWIESERAKLRDRAARG